jgi:hypothetical protein
VAVSCKRGNERSASLECVGLRCMRVYAVCQFALYVSLRCMSVCAECQFALYVSLRCMSLCAVYLPTVFKVLANSLLTSLLLISHLWRDTAYSYSYSFVERNTTDAFLMPVQQFAVDLRPLKGGTVHSLR